jgi:uncharacterized protein (DUF983 family)
MVQLPSHDDHQDHERWPPADLTWEKPEWTMPGWGAAIGRGALCRCPSCGRAPIFDGYLKVVPVCAVCAAPLGAMPADDTPPYIAMLIVLHVVAFVIVMIFRFGLVPNMLTYGLLLLLLIGVCLIALRVAKGAVIGILLKLGTKRGALG